MMKDLLSKKMRGETHSATVDLCVPHYRGFSVMSTRTAGTMMPPMRLLRQAAHIQRGGPTCLLGDVWKVVERSTFRLRRADVRLFFRLQELVNGLLEHFERERPVEEFDRLDLRPVCLGIPDKEARRAPHTRILTLLETGIDRRGVFAAV